VNVSKLINRGIANPFVFLVDRMKSAATLARNWQKLPIEFLFAKNFAFEFNRE
jgi:hypothetical protein